MYFQKCSIVYPVIIDHPPSISYIKILFPSFARFCVSCVCTISSGLVFTPKKGKHSLQTNSPWFNDSTLCIFLILFSSFALILDPCTLFCQSGNTVKGMGSVEDGTRCYSDKQKLDVCIQRKCRVGDEMGGI